MNALPLRIDIVIVRASSIASDGVLRRTGVVTVHEQDVRIQEQTGNGQDRNVILRP